MRGRVSRGDVWWCEPPDIGRRPVVVLSRDVVIPRLGRALVAPCTTNVRDLVTEVALEPGRDPVPQPCVVSLDFVERVSVGLLVSRLGRLDGSRMRELCAALAAAVDCEPPSTHGAADSMGRRQ